MKDLLNFSKIGSINLLTTILLVFLAAMLIAPGAQACHRLDKDGNPKPHGKNATCDDPNPSPPPAGNSTDAFLLGNYGHFKEESSRAFAPQGLENDSGDYVSTDMVSPIAINTRNMSAQPAKGKAKGLCRALEAPEGAPFLLTPESFSYGWTDDCRDGECGIEIRMTIGGDGGSSEQDILDISDGQSNQLDFVMYSTLVDDAGDANPFSSERTIEIYRVVGDYRKLGTTRSLVTCEYFPGGWGLPEFKSGPVSP